MAYGEMVNAIQQPYLIYQPERQKVEPLSIAVSMPTSPSLADTFPATIANYICSWFQDCNSYHYLPLLITFLDSLYPQLSDSVAYLVE